MGRSRAPGAADHVLGLDVTALYLVVPNLAANLAPTTTETLWIMDAYGFFVAGFLITMGTLGDRIGRRRLLMIGIAAFWAVSVFAAFAPGAPWLIAARALLGVAATAAFARRRLRLAEPLLDLGLLASRTFSAALTVLFIGLIGFGGTMYLVTQYLQLVDGLPPTTAGLWMGPPALAMLIGAVTAPLLTRRLSPGSLMAATLGLSLVGYALLASAGTGDKASVVTGFAFVYLGLGVIAALGTDLVVGAAPAERSGSAAALSETVQELGLAVGVALLGSLTTVIYRIVLRPPPGMDPAAAEPYGDGLSGASSVAALLPDGALDHARAAFTDGLNVSAAVAGTAAAAAALIRLTCLRHLRPLTGHGPADEPGSLASRSDDAGRDRDDRPERRRRPEGQGATAPSRDHRGDAVGRAS